MVTILMRATGKSQKPDWDIMEQYPAEADHWVWYWSLSTSMTSCLQDQYMGLVWGLLSNQSSAHGAPTAGKPIFSQSQWVRRQYPTSRPLSLALF